MSPSKSSQRLLRIVDALPLAPGMRVLEIGCGPGVAAREVARRIGSGFVLAIDRSATASALARRGSADEIVAGTLEFRCVAAEDMVLADGEALFDLAFAVRVGALDGRYPEAGMRAMARLREMLVPGGRLFIDGGDPLRAIVP